MENKVAVRNKAAQSAVALVGREKEGEREREGKREKERAGNTRGGRGLSRGGGTLVMHETHYFYLEQAESGAELQSIFCLSFSAPLIAHPLLILCPPTRPLSFYPQSTLSSIPFGSVLN